MARRSMKVSLTDQVWVSPRVGGGSASRAEGVDSASRDQSAGFKGGEEFGGEGERLVQGALFGEEDVRGGAARCRR